MLVNRYLLIFFTPNSPYPLAVQSFVIAEMYTHLRIPANQLLRWITVGPAAKQNLG
jgi:hypothetical protein